MSADKKGKYGPLVGAVDSGTGSTRFFVFAANTSELITYHQIELKQKFPHEGWVESDPREMISAAKTCIDQVCSKLRTMDIDPSDIKAIGVTNQRETTVAWDKVSGEVLYNAVSWMDLRTADVVNRLINKAPGRSKDYLLAKCGLPISTYFSALKIVWLIENAAPVRDALKADRLMVGTVDSWIIWNLTGGAGNANSVFITDVTNASRYMLMNLETLKWDQSLCDFFGIPKTILPDIRSSSEIYGHVSEGPLKGVAISGCLGDQQSALVGQSCLRSGLAKNTYGTGCFLLYNIGTKPVISQNGLLTTVAYKFGKQPAAYALEGSVAVTGAAVRWLRDNLGIIENSSDVEPLAASVSSTHGVYFVPAFTGLFAPHWVDDARGLIIGLTQFTTKAHIARATLEAACFQTKEILDCMNKESGKDMEKLQVDGGMTVNNVLMQLQADILGISVHRPSMPETTALGAAMAAGAAEGVDVWNIDPKTDSPITTDTFTPSISEGERYLRLTKWKKAVQRCMHWHDKEEESIMGSSGSGVNGKDAANSTDAPKTDPTMEPDN